MDILPRPAHNKIKRNLEKNIYEDNIKQRSLIFEGITEKEGS